MGDAVGIVADNYALWADVLTAPFPTIAALQGHTYGAGAVLALAHDQRTMRADRGYFCLPEVAIGMAFTPAMAALVQAKLSNPVAHHIMTTGQRFGGQEAVDAAIVDEAAGECGVLTRAIERAAALASSGDPATLGRIKSVMYAPVIALLRSTS
jgi:enoyl-CoA hydratase/carnithine racemase